MTWDQGPVVALTYVATWSSRSALPIVQAVGAHFGLTPRRYQSGESGL